MACGCGLATYITILVAIIEFFLVLLAIYIQVVQIWVCQLVCSKWCLCDSATALLCVVVCVMYCYRQLPCSPKGSLCSISRDHWLKL